MSKAIGPGGLLYLPVSIGLIAFFNYYYTFLQVRIKFEIQINYDHHYLSKCCHNITRFHTQLEPKDLSEQLKKSGAAIPTVRILFSYPSVGFSWLLK